MPLIPTESISLPLRKATAPELEYSEAMAEAERLLALRRWTLVGYSFPRDVVGGALREVVKTEEKGSWVTNQNRSWGTVLGGHVGYVPTSTSLSEGTRTLLDIEDGEGSMLLVWAWSALSDLFLERFCLFANCGVACVPESQPRRHVDRDEMFTDEDRRQPPIVTFLRRLCGCDACAPPNKHSPSLVIKKGCMGCGSLLHGLFDVGLEGKELCPARAHCEFIYHQSKQYAIRMDAIITKMMQKPEPREDPTMNKIPLDMVCSAAVQDVTREHLKMRSNGAANLTSGNVTTTFNDPMRLLRRVWFIRKRLADNRVTSVLDASDKWDLRPEFVPLCMTRLFTLPSASLLAAMELHVKYNERAASLQHGSFPAQQPESLESPSSPTGFPQMPATPCSTASPLFPCGVGQPATLERYPYQWKPCLAFNLPPFDGQRCNAREEEGGSSGDASSCLYRHQCAFCDEHSHGWSTCPQIADNPSVRVAIHCLYIDEHPKDRVYSFAQSEMESTAPSDASMRQPSVSGLGMLCDTAQMLQSLTETILDQVAVSPCSTTSGIPGSSSYSNSPKFPRTTTAGSAVDSGNRGLQASFPASASSNSLNLNRIESAAGGQPLRNASYESLDQAVLKSRVAEEEESLGGRSPTTTTAVTPQFTGEKMKRLEHFTELYRYCRMVYMYRDADGPLDRMASLLPFGDAVYVRHFLFSIGGPDKLDHTNVLAAFTNTTSLHFNAPAIVTSTLKPGSTPTYPSWWWLRMFSSPSTGVGLGSRENSSTFTCIPRCMRCLSAEHGWYSPACRPQAVFRRQLALFGVTAKLLDLQDFAPLFDPTQESNENDSDDFDSNSEFCEEYEELESDNEDGGVCDDLLLDDNSNSYRIEDDDDMGNESSAGFQDTNPSVEAGEFSQSSYSSEQQSSSQSSSFPNEDEDASSFEDGLAVGEDLGIQEHHEDEEHSAALSSFDEDTADKLCRSAIGKRGGKKASGKRVTF